MSRERFSKGVLGPHFERICRAWTLNYADPDRLGGLPAKVGQGAINDAAGKAVHQVDVVVTGIGNSKKTPLLAIGEAKWGEVMGGDHAERLRQIRSLLGAQCSPRPMRCSPTSAPPERPLPQTWNGSRRAGRWPRKPTPEPSFHESCSVIIDSVARKSAR